MKSRFLIKVFVLFLIGIFSVGVQGEELLSSDALFDKRVLSWPVLKEKSMPATMSPLPDVNFALSDIMRLYGHLNDGKSMTSVLRVNPEYMKRLEKGLPPRDGLVASVLFKERGIVFVTEHLNQLPLFGVYQIDGKDIINEDKSFKANVCFACHLNIGSSCYFGICSVSKKGKFIEK